MGISFVNLWAFWSLKLALPAACFQVAGFVALGTTVLGTALLVPALLVTESARALAATIQ